MTDKYWQTAIIPNQNEPVQQTYSYNFVDSVDNFQTDIVGEKISVSNTSSTVSYTHLTLPTIYSV